MYKNIFGASYDMIPHVVRCAKLYSKVATPRNKVSSRNAQAFPLARGADEKNQQTDPTPQERGVWGAAPHG